MSGEVGEEVPRPASLLTRCGEAASLAGVLQVGNRRVLERYSVTQCRIRHNHPKSDWRVEKGGGQIQPSPPLAMLRM